MKFNLRSKLKNINHFFESFRWYRFLNGKYKWINYSILLIIIILYYFSLPKPLFSEPISIVIEDEHQNLIGARIAKDGQWRFPDCDSLPQKYITCLIQFEDKRFYYHPGFDPISFGRALISNLRSGKIVSGGSTISMQTIRLSRNNPPRTIWEKLVEIFLVTRLEFGYSKKEILNLYASHAPFGGNVVGLEAASWRYFGKKTSLLTWAEAALMAVLPNNPALVHPGKNRQSLMDKRNHLLDVLYQKSIIDQTTLELSKLESLPEKPNPLPQIAPHLLDRIALEKFQNNEKITKQITTIDINLQESIQDILYRHHQTLKGNGINNGAAIVIDIETKKVLAYNGNIIGCGNDHGEQVDIINAPRGSGSVFKPILTSLMLDNGQISMESLISDVPVNIYGYEPENYFSTFDGVIPVKRALARSLNVPYIKLLQEYGMEKFHYELKKFGLTTLTFPSNHYGLPIILGGAETNLWDITNVYAKMARTLKHYSKYEDQYDWNDWKNASFYLLDSQKKVIKKNKTPFTIGAGSIWLTFEAMTQIERPDNFGNWELYQNSNKIAWKTGTSYGFRDAWSIGVNTKYAVGVWVGNADGEGRPGLIGIEAAAPILFDIFNLLQDSEWFEMPANDLVEAEICKNSGYLALDICPKEKKWVTKNYSKMKACPYHHIIHLDSSEKFRVTDKCMETYKMLNKSWFALPPVEEYYYKVKNPNYIPLPPYKDGCELVNQQDNPMQLIYPRQNSKIYVPIQLDGKPSATIFKATHKDSKNCIYWNLDQTYIGTTTDFHEISLHPSVGIHRITLVDKNGNRIEQEFEIVNK